MAHILRWKPSDPHSYSLHSSEKKKEANLVINVYVYNFILTDMDKCLHEISIVCLYQNLQNALKLIYIGLKSREYDHLRVVNATCIKLIRIEFLPHVWHCAKCPHALSHFTMTVALSSR